MKKTVFSRFYFYYLRGTQVYGQFTAKPQWFILYNSKFSFVLRIWRFQVGFIKRGKYNKK